MSTHLVLLLEFGNLRNVLIEWWVVKIIHFHKISSIKIIKIVLLFFPYMQIHLQNQHKMATFCIPEPPRTGPTSS